MGKLTELGPFIGTGEFYLMLDLLRNKDKYEKRFEEMEKLRKKVNDNIKSLGIGRNIESLYDQAKSDRRVAGETLAKAQDQAAKVYDETKERRQQLKDELGTLENTLREKNLELNRVTKEADSLLENTQAKADVLLRKAATDSQTAQKMLTQASQMREAAEEKKRKVMDLIGRFGGV